jgi:glycosyltransferase involved in cell wall biosynthesis
MAQELLSICIPTYNRSRLLGPLLDKLGAQIQAAAPRDVVIYVSDNGSPDATPKVVEEFQKRTGLQVVYSRNPENIGISKNLLKVMAMGKGRFVWTLGDDEIVADHAVANLVKVLRERDPGFVLMYDTRYPWPLPQPGLYADYQAFARECIKLDNVHALAEHTLLSSNIYRSEHFDAKFGEQNIETWFPHMFGFLRPLLKNRMSVLIPDFPVITTREEERSVPSDGKWANLDECWKTYLTWLRDEMRMPELDPTAASRAARRAMLQNMRAHPLQYVQKYWRALFQPSAYRFLWTRFFGVGK